MCPAGLENVLLPDYPAAMGWTVKSLYCAVNTHDNPCCKYVVEIQHVTNITTARRSNTAWLMQQFLQQRISEGAPPKGLEQEFAALLQVSPSMLSQIKSSRPIGDKLARQIESLCGQPVGWLDGAHAETAGPDEAEERFLALAREAWRAANATRKRELLRQMRHPPA